MEQVENLLDDFQGRFEQGDLQGARRLFALPAVIYGGEATRTLEDKESFESFLLENRSSISDLESVRLKRSFVQIDEHIEDRLVVNVIWIACEPEGNPVFRSPEVLCCRGIGYIWFISMIEHSGWDRVH